MSTPDNGWWDKHYPDLGPRQRLRLWQDNLPDLPQHTLDNLMEMRQKNHLNEGDQQLLNVYLAKHRTHQNLPTLSVIGLTSVSAGTVVTWMLSLSFNADQDVTGTAIISGQQDGDLLTPAELSFTISAGKPSVDIDISIAPITLTEDRSLLVQFTNLIGVGKPLPPARTLVIKKSSVTTKGLLTFPEPIGTVVRDATAETTVMVKVERQNVSTQDVASAPVNISRLPPGILKSVGQADFKAGSKYGYAPMVLHPYGVGVGSEPLVARPGHADLVTTELFNLGAVPSQDFLVQDGHNMIPGDNLFHDRVPVEVLVVLGFPFGWSMNWSPGDVAAWTTLTGRRPYVCSGGSHNGGRIDTWDACMGGPGGQLDYKGTNFAVAMAVIPRGGGLLVPTWWMTPDQGRGSYASLAGNAQYHDRAVGFGRAACAMMLAAGKDPGQLCPRWDKELNQDPSRAPKDASEVLAYAAAMATFIQGFDEGYTATQPVKPLHILGLARHDQIGPLENWVAKDASDKALISAIDISAHLPDSANGLAGHPVAEQAAATREWLRGGYDGRPSYSHDHADLRYNGKVVCQKYGLAMTNSECSPRNEPKMQCEISAGFWVGMFGFWKENATMMGPVGVFATSAIQPSSIPGWGDGIAMLGRCAQGLAP